MAAMVHASSDQIERERRLPAEIINTMKDVGVFGMARPLIWGGPELDRLTQFRGIETLAIADWSVGWCAMINCDGAYVTAFLDQDMGRSLYPDIQAPTAAAASIAGQATRVRGCSSR